MTKEQRDTRKPSIGLSLLLCVVVAAVCGLMVIVIFLTEPEAQREGATKKTPMLVDTTRISLGTYQPKLRTFGTVIPTQQTLLQAQVSGQIVTRYDTFEPGTLVKADLPLLQIDRANYQLAVLRAESDLENAKALLDIEQGEQIRAQAEYKRLSDPLPKEKRALVLREPQLAVAKARVKSAEAALAEAQLNLKRTTVKAPFDGQVLDRQVEQGTQVAVGDTLGTLAGVDAYWIKATLPTSQLKWLTLPTPNSAGSSVLIRDRAAWPKSHEMRGELIQIVRRVTAETRMIELLIKVKDPLGLMQQPPSSYPLLLGAFVALQIEAKALEQVVKLPREHLKPGDTVWVNQDGKLSIRPVNVVLKDEAFAYINSGLSDGDKLVVSNLSVVKEGALLREQSQSSESESP